ncbi:MAG: helix-turn-helix domain-containing protein [Ruminococcaceae bacterium]|nr:helix-turn-helix domain-containing protein [Oscillospiraceae bacterium]
MSTEDLPLALTVEDVAKILGIGRNSAYSLIHSGAIRFVRIGRQLRIPKSAILEYLGIPTP